MTISSIIIDDEPGNIATLHGLLKEYCPDVEVIATASNITDGYRIITQLKPQVVFLDIEMPQGNAFDLLDKLLPISFEVIFVTAFNDYAIKAFKYAALDYILKPVNIRELKDATHRIAARVKEKNTNARIESLLSNLKQDNADVRNIGLPSSEGLYFEDISNIMSITAVGNYTNVFIRGKQKEVVTKSIKEFEELLPASIFCRVHHSHIININFVKKYYKGRGGYVEMQDGSKIEISARKKDDFFALFKH